MKTYVVSICFKCFRRVRDMLQMFHMDVVKVDQGYCTCCSKCFIGVVQNVSSIPDICCKCSDLDVAYISSICCNICSKYLSCFSLILHMFSCYKLQVFLSDVAYVIYICCKCIFYMFHPFYRNVLFSIHYFDHVMAHGVIHSASIYFFTLVISESLR
jgi:hypothetical protein